MSTQEKFSLLSPGDEVSADTSALMCSQEIDCPGTGNWLGTFSSVCPAHPLAAEPLATKNPITVKQRFTSVPREKLRKLFCLKTVLSTSVQVGSQDPLKVLMPCCSLSWSRILANPDICVHLDQSLCSYRGHVGHTLSACFIGLESWLH